MSFFAQVMHSISSGGGEKPGDLSQSAFEDYVNWWQNIIGIISNGEESAAAEPQVAPIDQSACPPCSKYAKYLCTINRT